jgi:hypothetical protein
MKKFHRHGVIRICGGCLLVALLVAVSGCAGGKGAKGDVSGAVTYKGAAVTGGSVTLQPSSGQGFRAQIDGQGNYRVNDVPAGEYKVIVETVSAKFGMPTQVQPPAGMKPPPDKSKLFEKPSFGGMEDKMVKFVEIPLKYSKAESTPLTYKVTKGAQKHPIELTD